MDNLSQLFPALFIDPDYGSVEKRPISSDVHKEVEDYLGITAQPIDWDGDRRQYLVIELSNDLCFLSEAGDLSDYGGSAPMVDFWIYGPTGQAFTSRGIILRLVDGEFAGLPIGEETDQIIKAITFHPPEEHPLYEEFYSEHVI